MKRIKRWTASIVSGFDTVINQVENHESVVNCSIRELQEAVARAKVKLGRLRQEVARMQAKETEFVRAQASWQDRALALRDSDKDKAIECLRRRKRVEADLARLREDLPKHQDLAEQIGEDVSKLEARIDEIKRRKLAFSSRATRAKAMELTQLGDNAGANDVEDVFERWEVKLTETEIGASIGGDAFEERFLRDEERFDLERELEELGDGSSKAV